MVTRVPFRGQFPDCLRTKAIPTSKFVPSTRPHRTDPPTLPSTENTPDSEGTLVSALRLYSAAKASAEAGRHDVAVESFTEVRPQLLLSARRFAANLLFRHGGVALQSF